MSEWRYYEPGERKVPGVDATYLALKPVEHTEYRDHVVAVIRWNNSGDVSTVRVRMWVDPSEGMGGGEIRDEHVPLPAPLAHLEPNLVPAKTLCF